METNIEEIWKDIPEFIGYYQASNLGRIRRLPTTVKKWNGYSKKQGRVIKTFLINRTGYLCFSTCACGVKKSYSVHRMVALAFLAPIEGKAHVNHIDSNRTNNKVENLEWVNISENAIHSIRSGNRTVRGQKVVVDAEIANQIRFMNETGKNQFEIAALFSINQCTVSRVINRKRQYANL
jgi:hypothetical protein